MELSGVTALLQSRYSKTPVTMNISITCYIVWNYMHILADLNSSQTDTVSYGIFDFPVGLRKLVKWSMILSVFFVPKTPEKVHWWYRFVKGYFMNIFIVILLDFVTIKFILYT